MASISALNATALQVGNLRCSNASSAPSSRSVRISSSAHLGGSQLRMVGVSRRQVSRPFAVRAEDQVIFQRILHQTWFEPALPALCTRNLHELPWFAVFSSVDSRADLWMGTFVYRVYWTHWRTLQARPQKMWRADSTKPVKWSLMLQRT